MKKRMGAKSYFNIYKTMGVYVREYWDGPFRTLREAEEEFFKSYYDKDEKKQSFFIVKITEEFIPTARKPRR